MSKRTFLFSLICLMVVSSGNAMGAPANWELKAQYVNKAKHYETLLEHGKSVEELTKAIKLFPQDADLYDRRATYYAQLYIYDKAEADATMAIKLNPKRASYYRNRGRIYFRSGELQKAVVDYTNGIKLDPNDRGVYRQRGRIYLKLKQSQKAIADFKRFVDSNADDHNGEIRQELGNLYLSTGQYDLALEAFNKEIKLVPDVSGGYYGRAKVYEKLGKHNLAKRDWDKGREVDHLLGGEY